MNIGILLFGSLYTFLDIVKIMEKYYNETNSVYYEHNFFFLNIFLQPKKRERKKKNRGKKKYTLRR